MARKKTKPIVMREFNSSARSTSTSTPPVTSLPTSAAALNQPPQSTPTSGLAATPREASDEQPERLNRVGPSSRIAPAEELVTCPKCNATFPGSHLQRYRDHVESCTAAPENGESDEDSATDNLTTPPKSDTSAAGHFPLPYSTTEVDLFPQYHEEDEEVDEGQPRFRFAKLTGISQFQRSADEGENGSPATHFKACNNMYGALNEYQDEWTELEVAAKTSRLPPTMSIEDELDSGRLRGVLSNQVKPAHRVINPRAKPIRSDDPEKWFYTNQHQLEQDRIEGSAYGYIVKEGARDIGHQDPIGQRPRGPGQARDLRVRQPQRNAAGDDESGDESGLNAVNDGLLDGGRGKREKRPSTRVMGTNSRASSVDARAKPPRKKAPSRLAELEAGPSAADTLDSTQHWVDDVDARDGSGESADESGITQPHKGPNWSYLDSNLDTNPKKTAAGKKGKNAANDDSLNGELEDDEAAAAARARSQKRSEGAKMGWAKRKEALAAKESTQASVNGDGDEVNLSDVARPDPNDASDANSATKAPPKKKEKKMIQLENGTWIDQPSAATINMRRRWQKKREAEAKGLPPPKIGRYKKSDAILPESSSTPADFNDHNDQVLAAFDGAASHKRKQVDVDDEDDQRDEADKKMGKGNYKRRRKNMELSDAMIFDANNNDLVVFNVGLGGNDPSRPPPPPNKNGKRPAEDELSGQRPKRANRNTESLASSNEEDDVAENENPQKASSSSKKRANTDGHEKGPQSKKSKGTHIKKPAPARATETGRPPRLGSFVRPTGTSNRVSGQPPIFIARVLPDPPNLLGPSSGRPDARRPDARRPDARRPDARRPDARRPDARRPSPLPQTPLPPSADESGEDTEDEEDFAGFSHVPSGISDVPPPGLELAAASASGAAPRSGSRSLLPSRAPMDSTGLRNNPLLGSFDRPRSADDRHDLPRSSGPSDLAPSAAPSFKVPPRPVPVDRPIVNDREAPKPLEIQDSGFGRSAGTRKAPSKPDRVYDDPSSSPPRSMRFPGQPGWDSGSNIQGMSYAAEIERNRIANNEFIQERSPGASGSQEYIPTVDEEDLQIQLIIAEQSRANLAQAQDEVPAEGGPATIPSDSARGQVDDVPGSEAQAAHGASGDSAGPTSTSAPELAHEESDHNDTHALELAHGKRAGDSASRPQGTSSAAPALGVTYTGSGTYRHYAYTNQPALFDQVPKFDRSGVPIIADPASLELGKRERKAPKRLLEDEPVKGPATRSSKSANDPPTGGSITKRARTRGPTPQFTREGSVTLSIRTASPAPSALSAPIGRLFPNLYRMDPTSTEADTVAPTDTEKTSSSKASGNKGKSKAKTENEAPAATQSQRSSRNETPAPSQQPPPEQGSVTESGARPKRTNQGKPPKKYEDEVAEMAEEQRENSKSPSGIHKSGLPKERKDLNDMGRKKFVDEAMEERSDMDVYGKPGAATSQDHSDGGLRGPPALGSASKKNNKGKGARKSDTKSTKDTEADSPVASIEEHDDDMNSSQKTVVDPEVAEALAKREAARQAKSEKMKAITKARWASGEMHSVMEKKKANNALKKAALTLGNTAPIAIAPAPLTIAPAPAPKASSARKGSNVSQSPAPITPTLGGFATTKSTKAKMVIKPENKKEPRTKELAKAEGHSSRRASHSRGLSTDMDGSSEDHPVATVPGKKKLTEYELFLQLSSGTNHDDSVDGTGTRARSAAVGYEGRRSGRGGSLGGVGMERQISDDGLLTTGRKSKTVPRKLSEYEQFQQLSSPSAAGSPLPPRGRRPAALRATQTFGRFAEDDDEEVEEETISYAGPPVHGGHSRQHSRNDSIDAPRSTKKDGGKARAPTSAPKTKVKREEVEAVMGGGEVGEDSEESDSEEEGPKKKTLYDEWQDIIRNGGEGEEGGRRGRGRKSDAGLGGR